MKCQYCSCLDSKVIDSRPTDDGNSIRRRRECTNCGRRFTTYEKVELSPLFVVKRDGRRESFDTSPLIFSRWVASSRTVYAPSSGAVQRRTTVYLFLWVDQAIVLRNTAP